MGEQKRKTLADFQPHSDAIREYILPDVTGWIFASERSSVLTPLESEVVGHILYRGMANKTLLHSRKERGRSAEHVHRLLVARLEEKTLNREAVRSLILASCVLGPLPSNCVRFLEKAAER